MDVELGGDESGENDNTLRSFLLSGRYTGVIFEAKVQVISGGGKRYEVIERPRSILNGEMLGVRPIDCPESYEFKDKVHVPLRQHLEDRAVV